MQRPYRFRPTEDFTAQVHWNTNQYFKGETYTVRAGEKWDELHRLVQEEWLPAGKVTLG